jgi:hypothetical protein
MEQKEEETRLITELKTLQEGIQDLKETLDRITSCLKTEQVSSDDADFILDMLPDSPISQDSIHYLENRSALAEGLVDPNGVNEDTLLAFRDHYEEVQSIYVEEVMTLLQELQILRNYRDLAELNTWWRHCTTDERNVAFEAIGQVANHGKPGKLMSQASNQRRLELLIVALDMVTRMNAEAVVQFARWKKLAPNAQREIKRTIEAHTHLSPKQWWNTTPTLERSRVLRNMIDTLEASEEQKMPSSDGNSSVA